MDKELTCLDSGMWVVDRFEGKNAVLENTQTLDTVSLPKTALPHGINPGDTLVMQDGAWHFNDNETAARRQRIQTMFDRIRERSRE